MSIYKLDQAFPNVHDSAFVAQEATIIGNVTLTENVSVWPNATVRGDNEPITIGAGTNIQEGAVLHADPGFPLVVEERVSIGHQAMLHGCRIKEGTLVGIQAVILNGAEVGRNCLVAAGAIITERKVFPDNSLIMGVPAKVARELSEQEIQNLHKNAAEYVEKGAFFKSHLIRVE